MAVQPFVWYELMTTDIDAAETFYKAVVGWNAAPFDQSDFRYTVVSAGDRGVGGLMLIPEDAKAMGMPPQWMGYIHAPEIDASVASLAAAGGQVHKEPWDVPDVGRIAVVADPQGAGFMLIQPTGPDQPPVAAMTPGHIGWNELYAADWEKAWDFYSGQFGWTKSQSVDMGEMGTYQTYMAGENQGGGMMTKPPSIPFPTWLFYFNVEGIDAAMARVTQNGGQVMMGPHEVPGGSWILQCLDPQGAHFALVSSKR